MEALLAILVLAGGVGGLVGVGYAVRALTRLFHQEWAFSWQGRQVKLVAGQNTKELWVDGACVAQKTTLSGMGCTLSWTPEEAGAAPVVFSATVSYLPGAAKPVGRVYANGQWIGGVPREAAPDQAAAAGSAAPTLVEPKDVRWEPAKRLLIDLRAAGNGDAREAADRIEEGLRAVLGKLDRLEAARADHAALGGQAEPLDAARVRLDAQAQEVVEALREFHLVVLAGGAAPSLDRVEDLLGRVVAEAEVDEAARRRVAAGARGGQRV